MEEKTITLHDYEQLDEANMNILLKINDAIKDKTASNVLVINNENESNNKKEILQYFNGKWMISGCVGFLEYRTEQDDVTIIIKSRFDKNKRNDFSNYMIEKALCYSTNIFTDMHPNANKEYLLRKMLAIVFFQQITVACKKGIYRQYRTYEKNDSHPKGKIDIARHIKLNPLFNGNIAYSYREYTVDNDVNRLILTALDVLQGEDVSFVRMLMKQYDTVNRYFREIENILTPASRQECIGLLNRTSKKIHHSIYKDWEKVRQTAVLIIKRFGMSASAQGKKNVFGILFDMPRLWEKYIEKILNTNENLNKILAQEEKGIFYRNDNKFNTTTARPDFLISDSNNRFIVLDAKYKNAWSEFLQTKNWSDGKSVLRNDYFQVISYMYIFKCKIGGIICPCPCPDKESEAKALEFYLTDERKEKLIIFPIYILAGESYQKFKKLMEQKENSFSKAVEDCFEFYVNSKTDI